MKVRKGPLLVLIMIALLSASLTLPSHTALAKDEDNGMIQRGQTGYAFVNFHDLNDKLVNKGYEGFKSNIFLTGGSGFFEISDNFRLGGAGYQGSTTNSFANGNGKLSLNFFGVLFEAGMDVTERFTLMTGATAGTGTIGLRITESIPDSFDDALTDTPKRHKMDKRYFGIQPSLTMEFAVTSSISLRTSASYLWGTANKWNLDGKKFIGPIKQVNAPIITFGIHFGGNGKDEE